MTSDKIPWPRNVALGCAVVFSEVYTLILELIRMRVGLWEHRTPHQIGNPGIKKLR